MKFPSIQILIREARKTLHRFPGALLSAVLGTMASMWLVELSCEHVFATDYLTKMVMVCSLGITLFLSLSVFAETKGLSPKQHGYWQAIGFFVLLAYYFYLPAQMKGADAYRFSLINLDLHLLVAIAPFLGQKGFNNAFWQYNITLYRRIIIAVTYSVTLYIGLSVAILAITNLFSIKINEKIYFHLWLMVVGIFNTWFFLGGVPKNIKELENVHDYPKDLKAFTQYILIPLVTIYFVILYLYMGKIIVQWNLPKGWVSSFVIGVSLLGIFTLLLIYPEREKTGNAWMKIYAKYFYLALFPLIILMAVAISRRIMDYGITEERYFVFIYTVWLTFIAFKFSRNSKTTIRLIPTSLAIVLLFTTWGPWGAFSVSRGSQVQRLAKFLTNNGILVNGKIRKTNQTIAPDQNIEICSIINYLNQNHGLKVIKNWFPTSVALEQINSRDLVIEHLGLGYACGYRGYQGRTKGIYFHYRAAPEDVVAIEGFDYLYRVKTWGLDSQRKGPFHEFKTPRGSFLLSYDPSNGQLTVSSKEGADLALDMNSLVKSIRESHRNDTQGLPPEQLTLEKENEFFKVKVIANYLTGNIRNQRVELQSLEGYFLIKVK